MSKKFNLKNYEKINGDEHITMRLQKEHGKEANEINEKQLKDYRVNKDKDVTIQKLLEDKRTGEDDEITEKRLDTHKAKFENEYRNSDAYRGDINKLEEKRLKGETMESEKYEAASETPKASRWWEDVKSPDGLKVASKSIKMAQLDIDNQDVVEDLIGTENIYDPTEEEAEKMVEQNPYIDPTAENDFDIDDTGESLAPSEGMFILKQKDLENPKVPGANGIYMVLAYNPEQYGGDEDRIKSAAYEKVISARPDLAEVISPDDFSDIQESGVGGTVKLRAYGEDIYDFFQNKKMNADLDPAGTEVPLGLDVGGAFNEVSYKQKDVDGTPMVFGRILADEPVTEANRESILEKAVEFINQKHPEIIVDVDSLDLSKLDMGEINFMVSPITSEPGFESASPEELSAPTELEEIEDIEDVEEGGNQGLEDPKVNPDVRDEVEEEEGDDIETEEEALSALDEALGNKPETPPVRRLPISEEINASTEGFEVIEVTSQSNTKKK